MRRFLTIAVLTAIACGVSATAADAVPAFRKVWVAKYVDADLNPEFAAAVKKASCNVCHAGKKKTERNAYGAELSKLLDKADYSSKRMKGDESEKATAEIVAALDKIEAAKTPAGTTFKELFEAGELPADEPCDD